MGRALTLDPGAEVEGRVYDLIRQGNTMRKDAGLALTDRIVLTLPPAESELVERHGDWIKGDVLATEIRGDGDVAIPKVS